MALRALLSLALLLSLPLGALAQLSPEPPLTLSFSPAHPRPYDEVTVIVTSTNLDLSASDITISVDGAVVEEGKKSAAFKVGGAGTKTVVKATAVSGTRSASAEKTLRPADLALIVEPAATAHPFYEGGLLVPSEGKVRIIALADLRTAAGARVADKDVSYAWKLGDKALSAESGFGKSVLSATAPPRFRDAKVSVTATSRDGTVSAAATVSVSPADPVLRIYETDPLLGTNFAAAVGKTLGLSASEAGFRAVPYYFKSAPAYVWKLNGTRSGVQNSITVRSTGGSGSAALAAEAALDDAAAQASANLRFDAPRSGGIFGF